MDRETFVKRLQATLTPAALRGDLTGPEFWRIFGEAGAWELWDRDDPEIAEWAQLFRVTVADMMARRMEADGQFAERNSDLLRRLGRTEVTAGRAGLTEREAK